jgi:putative ABC transport system permease protein
MRPPVLSSVAIGIDTLRSNPLRTVLSTLGIIIGTAALVAVLSLGDGMERMGRDEIARTTDVQTVVLVPVQSEEIDGVTVPRTDYPVFTPDDAADAARTLPNAIAVHLSVTGAAIVEGPRGGRRSASVMATLAGAGDFLSLDFAAGRFFTPIEASHDALVVILSWRLASELSEGGSAESLLGQSVRLQGHPRRVIGVLARRRMERDRSAFVPLRAARVAMAPALRPRVPVLMLKAGSVEALPALQTGAEDWLARRYGRWEGRVKIETSQGRLEQVRRGMLVFKLFLGAITGISLVVGGIGIMNVLLASVAERTREIGVRKAIGARPGDVLVQFLAESVAISGLGSLLGVALGVTSAYGITAMVRARSEAPLYAAITPGTVLVAVLLAVLVGIAFGTYPALRAARLSPIDAIRND